MHMHDSSVTALRIKNPAKRALQQIAQERGITFNKLARSILEQFVTEHANKKAELR